MAQLKDLIVTGVARFVNKINGDITGDAGTVGGKVITDTYSGTSTNGMSGKAVKSAIDALDGTVSGSAGTSKTLTAFSQTDGKVSATFGDISITKSQVSDFPTLGTAAAKDVPSSGNASTTQVVMGNDTRLSDSRTPTSHSHGNIANGGTISSTAVTPANTDYILMSDTSNSGKIERGIAIGTDTTKYLRNDGTWQVPPDNNTTYTFAEGSTNGAFSVTPSGGSAQSVPVHGLEDLAFKDDIDSTYIKPLSTKTYTGLIGSSNDAANASFYFGTIMPTGGYYDIWKIHFKITAVAEGNNNAKGYFDCWITGTQSSMMTYHNYNTVVNTSYRTIYYTNLYRATSAGITAGYGHLLGIGMNSAWNPTTSANSRTFTVEILETIGCTYTPWDTALKYASVPGTGSTNYSGLSQMDAYTNGLRETGDDNSYAYTVGWNYYSGKTSANIGIWQTGLAMEDASGNLMSICTASDGTATSSNRTTATTKKANTYGFRVGSTVYFTNQSLNANVNISDTNKIFTQYGTVFDSRYSFNTTLTAGSLTTYQPIYLVGTINSTDGLFYLDTTWWTQTPNDSSKIYIYVGRCFDSTTSYCRIVLDQDNPWYRYEGGELKKLCYGYLKDTGGTLWGGLTMNGSLNMTSHSLANVSDTNTEVIRSNYYQWGSNPNSYYDALFLNQGNDNFCWSVLYKTSASSVLNRYSGRPIANFESIPNTIGDLIVTNGPYANIKHIAADKAISHNNIYRGEELLSSSHFGTGSTCLTALHNAVSSGIFSDIYIGDTITITMDAISGFESASQTVVWVVMGIDLYINQAIRWTQYDSAPHHLVLVPKDCFTSRFQWHTSNDITSCGYKDSYIHSTVLAAYDSAIKTSLGNYLLRGLYNVSTGANTTGFSFSDGTNGGAASNGIAIATPWLCLLNEVEIYGYRTISSQLLFDVGIDSIQLPGFRLNPNLIFKKTNGSYAYWWLKSIVKAQRVGAIENANNYGAWGYEPTQEFSVCPKIFFG